MGSSILLVDDDPCSRRLSAEIRARGHAVTEAGSFDEGMEIVARLRPEKAIVELSVGGGSALDFLARLRERASAPRVLVMSAFAHVGSAVAAMRLGAVGYLCKPLPASAVLGAFDGRAGEAPSLEVAIGMHLEYSMVSSGSVSGAARRLGLDRRSLRRMLLRYPKGRDPR